MILPTNGCSLELCIHLPQIDQLEAGFHFLETWSLSVNVTKNMIGAAVNSYVHVIGSQ